MRRRSWLAYLAFTGCVASTPNTDWATVEQGDLILEVEVTGALSAVDSVSVGPPPIPEMWDFKISRMATEGKEVRKGDMLISFDTVELQQKLDQKKNERDATAKELEKKRSDAAMARHNEALQIADAEAALRKATLKTDQPSDLTGTNQLKLAELDRQLAQASVEHWKNKARFATAQDEADMEYLRGKTRRAEERVKEIQTYIDMTTVTATRDGTIIYSGQADEKKKVGDSAWRGEKLMATVSLSQMEGEGDVDEMDAAKIAVDQPVSLRLDAHPDLEYPGKVQSIRKTVSRQSHLNPLKVVKVDVALDKTEPLKMRPGMRFRGDIETGRVTDTILVPINAVFVSGAGPVAYRKTDDYFETVRVTIGQRNKRYVEVLEGLEPGSQVAVSDLGAEDQP